MNQPVKQLFNPTVILNNLDTIDASLVVHEHSISVNTSSINNLETTLGNIVTSVNNLETTVGNNVTSINNLETNVGNNVTSINNLETTLGNIVTSVNNLETTVGNNVTSINNLVTDLDNNVTYINNLETTVGDNVTSINNLVTTVGNNVTSINNLETNVGNNVTSINNLVTAVAPTLREYEVKLIDMYGDAWDGGYLEIKNIDSGSTYNIEFIYDHSQGLSNSNRYQKLWLPDGNYEVQVKKGYWLSEMSWSISLIRPLSSNPTEIYDNYQTIIAGTAPDLYSMTLPQFIGNVSNPVMKKYIFNIRSIDTSTGPFTGKIEILRVNNLGPEGYNLDISPLVLTNKKELANIVIFFHDDFYTIKISDLVYDINQPLNKIFYLDILNEDGSISIENIPLYNTTASSYYTLTLPNMEINIPDLGIQPTPTVEGPDNTLEFDVAFHVVQEDNTWTEFNNSQLTDQIAVLNTSFTTTSKSMFWNDNLSDEEQNVLATEGGKPMKISFNLKKSATSGDNNYFSLITPESVNWDPLWLNAENITNANEAYGHNISSTEIIKTINVWISPSGSYLGYAYFPSAVGSNLWYSWIRLDTLPQSNNNNCGLGKTLVHEIGHNFGLDHTFNPDIAVGGSPFNDTPYHTEPNFGSYIDENGNPYPNDSNNIPDSNSLIGRDPVYNYMNYTNDDTTFRFTDDQLHLIWSNIETYLSQLWDTAQNETRSESKNVTLAKRYISRINKKHLNDAIENSNIFKVHEHECKRCSCKMPHFAIDEKLFEEQPQIIKKYLRLNNMIKNRALEYKPKNLKMVRKEK